MASEPLESASKAPAAEVVGDVTPIPAPVLMRASGVIKPLSIVGGLPGAYAPGKPNAVCRCCTRFGAFPIAQAISTVVAPCDGLIWLGDLSLLNPMGNPAVDPYAQYTKFAVLEFGASYGSGGIGSFVQPLIGERIFGTLTPNWQG